MASIKCIIRQGWTNRDEAGNLLERRDYVYVTDEAGNPIIYDSITEARAEIRGNYGRDANRAGILRTHSVDDYTGHVHEGYVFIVREDTDEYAEATAAETAALEALEEYGNAEDAINAAAYGIYADRHNGARPDVTDADQMQELNNIMQQVAAIIADRLTIEAVNAADAAITAEDLETAEDLAQQAEAAADQAGTEHAHDGAEFARWKVEAARNTISDAADREQIAELLASIEDPATRSYFTAEASKNGWSAEELAEAIQYRRDTITANAAALELLEAYTAVVGEYLEEDDPETIAAYRVARDEIRGSSTRATDDDRAIVADMVEAIAEDVRDLAAARLEYATRDIDLTRYESEYLELEPARVTYQRYELEAFLGEPDAYDLEAIEAEATEYDPATSRTVWARGIDLAAIAERHELTAYYPATA